MNTAHRHDTVCSPTFPSDEAAIAHYRSRCSALQAQLAAAEQDILEFTESSKELQAELEGELERMDKAEKGMRRELEDARNEKEEWKVRKYPCRNSPQSGRTLDMHPSPTGQVHDRAQGPHDDHHPHAERARDLACDRKGTPDSRPRHGTRQRRPRKEREVRQPLALIEPVSSAHSQSHTRREKDSSLQNLETRYNKALERIALLEEELVAKAQLEEEVQRLKDEVRGALQWRGALK